MKNRFQMKKSVQLAKINNNKARSILRYITYTNRPIAPRGLWSKVITCTNEPLVRIRRKSLLYSNLLLSVCCYLHTFPCSVFFVSTNSFPERPRFLSFSNWLDLPKEVINAKGASYSNSSAIKLATDGCRPSRFGGLILKPYIVSNKNAESFLNFST